MIKRRETLWIFSFILLIWGFFIFLPHVAYCAPKIGDALGKVLEHYNTFEKQYEINAPKLYYKLLSPTATRIITSVSLLVSFVLLIRTRNPRIFLPFYFIAFFFAYLAHFFYAWVVTR